MGPEQVAGTFTIPAKHRWDTGQMQLFITAEANGRLSNLSTRGQVLSGDAILIAGFVVAGTTEQTLLLRGIGPALNDFLDPDIVLADAVLTVYDSNQNVIMTNDDWSTQADPIEVARVTAAVGGFALEADSLDAALVGSFAPGAYSMHLSGKAGSGIALAEIYDADGSSGAQLLNISTRGRVGSGAAVMVPGIVVTESSRRLLIRGIGPELAASFGFAPGTTLPDPVLTLKNAAGETIASNDNWGDGDASATAEIIAVAQQVGAFPLTSGGGDAVLLVTLPPGVYTAQVLDSASAEGIAIVEVYAVPE